jgi:amino acid adenylation domain-containing protein
MEKGMKSKGMVSMKNTLQQVEIPQVTRELLTDWSIHQKDFNNTTTDYPRDKTISQLFEECAANNSENIAVYSDEKSITYQELNAKANQLANYLRKSGVGRNSLVALYLERSVELIISILAIVKAGGIYLPLGTDDPSNRTRVVLQDSNPTKILTSSDLYDNLCSAVCFDPEDKIIRVNIFFQEKIETDELNHVCLNSSHDPIYVMYTSGSSGKPKGCVIPHCGVIRLVKNMNYVQISATDHIAQIANAAFDAMTFEMWGALLNGASLHIIPQISLLSVSILADTLKRNNITILFITTALLNLVVKDKPDAFDDLKYLLFGGEKANAEIVNTLLKRKLRFNLKDLNVVHVYGPTECTTFAIAFPIEQTASIKQDVPIGKPISNTQAYVLDEKLQCMPPGEIGELYLGGDGLAFGYLNDPKQTTEKFIQNPLNSRKKLYKTGDLVYWLPDVGIVYVNRTDSQVKINGFRVEISEVEASIVKNRVVKQATVIAQEDSAGRKELIAYVCFYENKYLNFSQFHQYLKENIAYYMMPKKVIQVDHIPLTINGKTDKVRLAEMKGRNILEADIYDDPTNQIEKMVAEVWQELLGMGLINTNQNFFDLGAHSLMLGEACSLLNSQLNEMGLKPISILDILSYPTIQLLTKYASEREKSNITILKSPTERAAYQRKMLLARRPSHATKP